MSTIEKAVDKLDSFHKGGIDPAPPPQVNEEFVGNSPIERSEYAADLDDRILDSESNARVSDVVQERIVHIPWKELSSRGMVSIDAPRSQIAEEYRVIKRPLLMNISGKSAEDIEHPNLIMVTSCLQGEGKTFSAINLAVSMSMEKDKTVLFIDGDVSKATAGSLLGVPNDSPGLIDLLEHDDVAIEDVLLSTSIPNLRIIPAGHINERSTELLASQQMLQLAKELSEFYPDRVIIFDSPPLLLTTEARVLANAMGQVVFVVAAEQTSNDALKEGIEYLAEDKVVGMVLNKAKRNLWDKRRYGYGYGYGYGEGESRQVSEGMGAAG